MKTGRNVEPRRRSQWEDRIAERIGLIGIGAMGGPMGENLLKAGHSLVIHSRTRTRPEVERLIQAGATFAASPAEVGSRVGIAITIADRWAAAPWRS
jgi:3-hydroxyisobutyrate dehydrogenase-like beta-hydroxyacid dehydrogenase